MTHCVQCDISSLACMMCSVRLAWLHDALILQQVGVRHGLGLGEGYAMAHMGLMLWYHQVKACFSRDVLVVVMLGDVSGFVVGVILVVVVVVVIVVVVVMALAVAVVIPTMVGSVVGDLVVVMVVVMSGSSSGGVGTGVHQYQC